MRNRNRRISEESKHKTRRGAYKKPYSEEDQELIKDLEFGETNEDLDFM